MIEVSRIVITRGEGPSYDCRKPQTVATWAEAQKVLYQWSTSAPRTGGYDKCYFCVTWTDGQTHTGRYDLKHHTCERPDLGGHVRAFYLSYSLRRMPGHYASDADRARFVAHVHAVMTADEIADCGRVLDNYDLGA